ncbi:hypothetical protein [Methanobrevibacter sp.]|uniref:hypothetical protein n=1 Tax=Methanobrevibacter sp. TaxID=66852 RepID=UPI0025CE4D07|nr:hypothetical protein [Methanobrevibacter sp.]MBQ2831800.1 hypothetical protein [Methanobrevibacter sp.]
MDSSYDVWNDKYFKNYITKKGVTEGTANKYAFELKKLCIANDIEFTEFIKECKIKQSYVKETPINIDDSSGVIEYFREEYDVDEPNSFIKKGLDNYVDYCKEKKNHNSNINNSMSCIRGILSHYNLKLPKWTPLEDDAEEWYLLEKEDFIFILNDCSLNHKSLITFMLSSGIRLGDCLKFTIGDFMKATSDFHEFVDVDDFIDNAPQDMMGFWDFKPNKTKRHGILCKTFNSPESSNYILQNLRRVKNEYLPKKNMTIVGEKLKMSKNNALFGSHHGFYQEPLSVKGISEQFRLKNKKLHEWHVNKLKWDIENGKLSEDDFDDKIREIPKFHAHGCRKYFQTMVSRHCGDIRLCAIMEGHASPIKTDPSYIKHAKEFIKEVYGGKLLESLTLENVDVKVINNEEFDKLNNQIDRLREELAEARNSIPSINNQYEKSIWNILNKHYRSTNFAYLDYKDEADVLCQYALEFAIKDIINFNKDDENYLERLFDKAKAVNELFPNKFDETLQKAKSHYSKNSSEYNSELKSKVRKILVASSKYGFVENIVKNNYKLAESNVAKYVEENKISLEDLEDSELIKEILFEVVVES